MRILGHMVVRNEADRFLAQCLGALIELTDQVAVFDDQSDDATVDIARDLGAIVAARADDETPFLVHEGQFRNTAWQWMEATLQPERGDWIFVVDADQLIYGATPTDLLGEITEAKHDTTALCLHVDELWALNPARRRTDGWWGHILSTCLFRWHPGSRIADKVLACGSVPLEGRKATIETPRLAHLGYVREADRVAKYERYHGKPGHNPSHVSSIIDRSPLLEPVDGLHV